MKSKTYIKYFILIVVLSNTPPIKSIISLGLDEKHYRYSNNDGTRTFISNPYKGKEFLYKKYFSGKNLLDLYPGADTTVYRLYKKDFWAFWRWGEYVYDKRYTLPYKSWDSIKAHRRIPGRQNSSFQDF